MDRQGNFNLDDASMVTGIRKATISRHLEWGWINAFLGKDGQWYIPPWEVIDYAFAEWERGSVIMLPPGYPCGGVVRRVEEYMEFYFENGRTLWEVRNPPKVKRPIKRQARRRTARPAAGAERNK